MTPERRAHEMAALQERATRAFAELNDVIATAERHFQAPEGCRWAISANGILILDVTDDASD